MERENRKQEAIQMANYIWSILARGGCITLSWGISERKAIIDGNKVGLQMRVNGFLYKGIVRVLYNEGSDLFDLYFQNGTEDIEGIYLDQLIDVLDQRIETLNDESEEYKKKCTDYLGYIIVGE